MRVIRLSEQGILPGAHVAQALCELFLKYQENTEFVFDSADYIFSSCEASVALFLQGMKHCRLSGNGARLLLSGPMGVFALKNCCGMELDGFTVQWEKPTVAEGEVLAVGMKTLDVRIDPKRFPHRLEANNLTFDLGAEEWSPLGLNLTAYEPHGRMVRRGAGDLRIMRIMPLGDHTYRIFLREPSAVCAGDLISLRHGSSLHAGLLAEECEELTVQNITFHDSCGQGCAVRYCRNVTLRGLSFLPDATKGRRISCIRDHGISLVCNSGVMRVEECLFHGLAEDCLQMHGCYLICNKAVDGHTLHCSLHSPRVSPSAAWAKAGDELAFVHRGTLETFGGGRVESCSLEEDGSMLLRFAAPLSEAVLQAAAWGEALALENTAHTADLFCADNLFGSGRMRGMQVNTSGRVRITGNLFSSGGAAILVMGDAVNRFESGACRDLEISDNIFTESCLTARYPFCDAVINLRPNLQTPVAEKPYHQRVCIRKNTFHTASTPVLNAFSVGDLRFAENRILHSASAERWHWRTDCIRLSHCPGAVIDGNRLIGKPQFKRICASDLCEGAEIKI